MIKKLKRRFIAVAMCSLGVVLFLVIAIVNTVNYNSTVNDAERLLNVIIDNDGSFPKEPMRHDDRRPADFEFSPEAPFNTRYFTVVLNSDGVVKTVDTGKIAAVSSEQAAACAKELFADGEKSGFYGDYRYRAVGQDGGVMYAFLDCRTELETFRKFLTVSIAVSLAGYLAVFALVMFLSWLALRPVVISYEKQKRFITDAGHELKTPLAVISAAAEVIEMENGEGEWTDNIKGQVQKLNSLTENLILLSRTEESRGSLMKQELDLSRTVTDAAEPFKAVATASRYRFTVDVEENIIYNGNGNSIARLCTALLDNAMKYTDPEGEVVLSLKFHGKHPILTVSNSYMQAEKGSYDRLFDRFFRTDESRNSATGGFGIGLSVVKAISEAHGGTASAFSPDGKTMVFKIKF